MGGGGTGGGAGGDGFLTWLMRILGIGGTAASAEEQAVEDMVSKYGALRFPIDKAINMMIKGGNIDGSPESVRLALTKLLQMQEAVMGSHTPTDIQMMLDELQSESFSLSEFLTYWHLDNINVRW